MIGLIGRTVTRAGRAATLTAIAITLGVMPATAQKAAFTEDIGAMTGKFTSLAEAMGEDTYGWRPMEGVRSVSEVYMLITAEAYFIPSFWGADPPEGMEISTALFGELSAVTDKTEVLEHLAVSFEYLEKALEGLNDQDMGNQVSFFGQDRPLAAAIFMMLGDMHEHLGQAIAYARSNEVVPPWSAGG